MVGCGCCGGAYIGRGVPAVAGGTSGGRRATSPLATVPNTLNTITITNTNPVPATTNSSTCRISGNIQPCITRVLLPLTPPLLLLLSSFSFPLALASPALRLQSPRVPPSCALLRQRLPRSRLPPPRPRCCRQGGVGAGHGSAGLSASDGAHGWAPRAGGGYCAAQGHTGVPALSDRLCCQPRSSRLSSPSGTLQEQ
ncbi:hypothetical protein CLOP_g14605 [Closterium sp. NIES-67]|nr:hypothetical protein CLOP_g14605 [Closterium sp. NIES-67]